MKSLIKIFLILCATNASTTMSGEVGQAVIYPQWIYESVAKTFPEFVKPLDGISAEIILDYLSCTSSNEYNGDHSRINVFCSARNVFGQTITREGREIFLALINSGFHPDLSDPGSSTIKLKGLSCLVSGADVPESYECLSY